MDAPTASATHPTGRHQRLAAVAKDIGAGQPNFGQPVDGHTAHHQLFRIVRFRHTRRRRLETLATGGISLSRVVEIVSKPPPTHKK